MTKTEFKNFTKMTEELKQLREEKKIWEKVCTYEKKRWIENVKWRKLFPGTDLFELEEHIKNIEKLAGE